MTLTISPLTCHRDHAISSMAKLADVLLSSKRNTVSSFGITGLINDQHPLVMRGKSWISLP